MPPREAELYRRCDEVLHYLWDPIGVAGAPEARDEYDSYLPHIFALVRSNVDPAEIVDALVQIETESIGLSASRRRAGHVAALLLEWRQRLLDDAV